MRQVVSLQRDRVFGHYVLDIAREWLRKSAVSIEDPGFAERIRAGSRDAIETVVKATPRLVEVVH